MLTTNGSKNVKYINTPAVLAFAKTYFNDATLVGAPLEDEGGDGSANTHWEKLYFGNEIMTS